MPIENIHAAILETLREIQEANGHPWQEPPLTCIPVLHVQGFDSLCSIEASLIVEEKLGCPDLVKGSLFISEDGTCALSIAATAERIRDLITTRESA